MIKTLSSQGLFSFYSRGKLRAVFHIEKFVKNVQFSPKIDNNFQVPAD
jgi:hypothetical protein